MIKVPEGMLARGANRALCQRRSKDYADGFSAGVEFACQDLATHPVPPTDEQLRAMRLALPVTLRLVGTRVTEVTEEDLRWAWEYVQRMMFEEEREPPEEVKRLLLPPNTIVSRSVIECANRAIVDAYNLGRGGK